MSNGTRILLNSDGIITDWSKQHFEPVASPLSAISNPKVAYDLLTPLDNSRHGFSVQQGVQKLKPYGLQFQGTAGSQTDFTEAGLAGLSFLTAFRFSAIDTFQYVLDCRDLTVGSGHGFAITYNPTGQRPSCVLRGLMAQWVFTTQPDKPSLLTNGMWPVVSFPLTAITN